MESIPKPKSVSEELQELFDADQADRAVFFAEKHGTDLPRELLERDAARLEKAREIYTQLMSGTASLSNDQRVQLAFLFQHSFDSDDYRRAYELGNSAGDEGKWIAAAAEDRWLLSRGERQKWGTQFINDTEQAPMMSDAESGITDEMRVGREIPPRAEQLQVHVQLIEPK